MVREAHVRHVELGDLDAVRIQHEVQLLARVAARIRRQAEAVRADYESKLREIDAMSRKKIEEAMREAGRLSGELKEKAREESNAILAKAQAEIERERSKARVALRVAEAFGYVDQSEIEAGLDLADQACAVLWRMTHPRS